MGLKRAFFLLVILISLVADVHAQINGIVFDQASRKPIAHVEIINLTNQEKTVSNDYGEFTIIAKMNHLLVFRRPGYRSDTLMLVDLKPLRRYMAVDKNILSTVVISGQQTLREQYAHVFNKANPILLKQGRGLLFYPSNYFTKESKHARQFVKMLKREEKEKIIDRRFNLKTVASLLPIKQPELDAFLVLYRPTLQFIERAKAEDFKNYVLHCYQKFKLLPSEKRGLPSLKAG
ncbi:peptidase associated/transthyretin-like domain-containing protein [Pedobacter insulae]|uniref:CarboxypepD_reg-like domain-containing protein n=1 Tax=Pedobacter insulae TaxID=414048 RepID=A0A1I2ZVT0_9SPHI|nr:carboxypeptidase regulatory-like domain-containing protein [Pedobacter insulae]SFH41726.1 hypothetical protein SAMN04489864_111122 [Pedobacter insulae]